MPLITDRSLYIAPDGVEFMLSPPIFVLQEDGLGMPPIEYVTQRGPFQHGETVKALWLRPRVIDMTIRQNGCSRAEYWDIRNTLLSLLRPNRGPYAMPGILRKYMANGQVREWLVYPSEGPGFQSHDPNVWNEWSIQTTLRFTCFDPVARDPRLRTAFYTSLGLPGTFPLSFPVSIPVSTGSTGPAVNNGNWDTFPSITINGPVAGVTILNLTTNEKIALSYALPAARSLTINLDYGQKTVALDDSTSLEGYVTPDSDLGTFHLQPGSNNIQVVATGTSGTTSTALAWYDKYIGA